MKTIGKCPYCKNNVISKKVLIKNKNINVYQCINTKKEYDESNTYVYSSTSKCRFMIYENIFSKWNQKSFKIPQVKELLENKQIKIKLYSKHKKKEYEKYVILDKNYGCSILWQEDI